MCSLCAVCQKDYYGMTETITPVYRTLHPGTLRKAIGIDNVKITPANIYNNDSCDVVVVHATKLSGAYAKSEHTRETTARSLFQFYTQYGVYENIISDPGCDLTSEAVSHLNRWFGVRHIFSLVDRHESNGVEGTNKELCRHFRALCADKHVKSRWSSPENLGLVQYILNSTINAETGMAPYTAHFGTEAATYHTVPVTGHLPTDAHKYVKALDSELAVLWEASKKHQASLTVSRTGDQQPETQNQFQRGDLVFFQRDPAHPRTEKLSCRFSGPFEVLRQRRRVFPLGHARRLQVPRGTAQALLWLRGVSLAHG
jgi:hypothetical protein